MYQRAMAVRYPRPWSSTILVLRVSDLRYVSLNTLVNYWTCALPCARDGNPGEGSHIERISVGDEPFSRTTFDYRVVQSVEWTDGYRQQWCIRSHWPVQANNTERNRTAFQGDDTKEEFICTNDMTRLATVFIQKELLFQNNTGETVHGMFDL